MDEKNYDIICDFVHKRSGIVLSKSKSYLIESRLEPITKKYGFEDIEALNKKLPFASSEIQEAVIDAMTTNESFFFRDNTPFDNFKNFILPQLATARGFGGKIRIWCAAASTGQEPYSLAMLLLANKRLWAGLNIEIIGTDISQRALEKAKKGKYSQFEVQRGLPVQMLVDHFKQEGTHWIISDEIKNMVSLKKMNLLSPFSNLGKMDLIFCRNVLIYFDVETKKKIVQSMNKILQPDGFMVLGAAETMLGISDELVRSEGHRGLYCAIAMQDKMAASA